MQNAQVPEHAVEPSTGTVYHDLTPKIVLGLHRIQIETAMKDNFYKIHLGNLWSAALALLFPLLVANATTVEYRSVFGLSSETVERCFSTGLTVSILLCIASVILAIVYHKGKVIRSVMRQILSSNE